MSYSVVLKSSVPEDLKVARSTVKGSITRSVNRLEAILVRIEDEVIISDHATINKIEVKDLHDKISKCMLSFQDLNDRYCEVRLKDVDPAKELKAIKEDENYVNVTLDKIYSLLDTYNKCNRSSVKFEQARAEIDSIPIREKQLKASREEFNNAKEAACKMVEEDEEEIKPAEYVKTTPNHAFNKLVDGANLARTGYEARKDDEGSYAATVNSS